MGKMLLVTKRLRHWAVKGVNHQRHGIPAMDITRSASPPKSACWGINDVDTVVAFRLMAVFFARMVIPRSFSKSFGESIRS